MTLPLVLISEESLEIAINAWDALFFGVAEIRLEFGIKNFLYIVLYVFRIIFYKLHISLFTRTPLDTSLLAK